MTEKTPDTITNGNRLRNILIALAAIGLSVALFLGINTESGGASLEAQANSALPLEIALSNGKPTLTEFYANWCTSCQAMAKDLAQLKKEYGKSVNFVMLNVDNSKWLPEILRYRIDGIPHFVFLDAQGNAIAQSIGEQPLPIMEANLDALIAQSPLPYASTTGQTSDFKPPITGNSSQDDPRSHGNQVKRQGLD
jgi:thiol-disulfide isomerase/thioredoxin